MPLGFILVLHGDRRRMRGQGHNYEQKSLERSLAMMFGAAKEIRHNIISISTHPQQHRTTTSTSHFLDFASPLRSILLSSKDQGLKANKLVAASSGYIIGIEPKVLDEGATRTTVPAASVATYFIIL